LSGTRELLLTTWRGGRKLRKGSQKIGNESQEIMKRIRANRKTERKSSRESPPLLLSRKGFKDNIVKVYGLRLCEKRGSEEKTRYRAVLDVTGLLQQGIVACVGGVEKECWGTMGEKTILLLRDWVKE